MIQEAQVKKILSISVGSSSRDHTTRHTFLGQECELSRQGTDGDFNKAVQRYADMDGKVDAFGVGGVEFFLRVGRKRYYFRDVARIRRAVKVSKIGDGFIGVELAPGVDVQLQRSAVVQVLPKGTMK